MTFYLTLVASSKKLQDSHITAVSAFLQQRGRPVQGAPEWLCPDKAADLLLGARPDLGDMRALRELLRGAAMDAFINPVGNRRKKLLIADMDSTIVDSETLDELATHAGIREQIAAITTRAMNGALDFRQALRERVGLLRGLPESALHEALSATTLNKGAKTLVRTMKKNGACCVLVSGGFTCFTAPVAKRCGFDAQHGNTLLCENGKLTGEVGEPILDKDSKLDFLETYCRKHGLERAETMAIGDGANDLPMLQAAGLGIGYRPKPLLEEKLVNCIIHGDLTAALYAQGYKESDFTN